MSGQCPEIAWPIDLCFIFFTEAGAAPSRRMVDEQRVARDQSRIDWRYNNKNGFSKEVNGAISPAELRQSRAMAGF
jgi:hypothetical protein